MLGLVWRAGMRRHTDQQVSCPKLSGASGLAMMRIETLAAMALES